MKSIFILVIFIIFTVVSSVVGMPPHPESVLDLSDDESDRIWQFRMDAMSRGLDAPGISVLDNMQPVRRDDPNEVMLRVPVILVDFDDNEAARNDHPSAYYDELLFSLDEYETGSMRDWYSENSDGAVHIIGQVIGWFRMEEDYSYYVNEQFGIGNYPRNSQRLAEDLVQIADEDIDYGEFDNDDDGQVDAVFIVFAGEGAEENPRNEDLIWSHSWRLRMRIELDNVDVYDYVVVPENGRIGVFGHELGHALFGLPDLYDTRGGSAGIGNWSMMSYGAWGDNGRRPVHFDAWCKLQLGWVNARVIDEDDVFALDPVEETHEIIILWNPDDRGDEYFLAENRAHIGFDGELPGTGLLVYHCDDSRPNNDYPWWPGHEDDRHNIVSIEQADGNWDLEQDENLGDEGDPFPGSEDNRRFDADSNPNSRDYGGNDTGVAIVNISHVGNRITARWMVGVEGPGVAEHIIALSEGWNLISSQVTPPDDDIRIVMAQLVQDDLLFILKDARGRFYAPFIGENGFNNIPGWNETHGYYARALADCELIIAGRIIDAQQPIPAPSGWQIVPYYPDYELSAEEAFQSIADDMRMAKNARGRFYIPEIPFNNMSDLRPGEGYQVYLHRDVELIYPEQDD